MTRAAPAAAILVAALATSGCPDVPLDPIIGGPGAADLAPQDASVAADADLGPDLAPADVTVTPDLPLEPDLPPNPPTLTVTAKPTCLTEREETTLTAALTGGQKFTCAWKVSAGTIVGSGASVGYRPPQSGPHPCPYLVGASVQLAVGGNPLTLYIPVFVGLAGDLDGDGVVGAADLTLLKSESGRSDCCTSGVIPCLGDLDVDCDVDAADEAIHKGNLGKSGCKCPHVKPTVLSSTVKEACITQKQQSTISVLATDPAGGLLKFAWQASKGTLSGSGPSVVFTPPKLGPHPCPYKVKGAFISEVSGQVTFKTFDVVVRLTGDLDGDGDVDSGDAAALSLQKGRTNCCGPTTPCSADLDGDCDVDGDDESLLKADLGQSGCKCP